MRLCECVSVGVRVLAWSRGLVFVWSRGPVVLWSHTLEDERIL